MQKLSIKLGLIFLFIIFGLEIFMFFFLHSALVDSRVEEELIALQTRGNSHRDILERNFDRMTISHVALMESEANTDVVVTDENKQILDSSVAPFKIDKYIQSNADAVLEDEIVEDNWKEEGYIATVSVIRGDAGGYVYMFQNTASIHSLIERLNRHFLVTGLIVIALTIVIIFFVSNALVKPLNKMKAATAKISKGDFSVSLPETGNDELGELSKSIQLLADDLNYLKQERTDFLASISHELRTPLTYIKGYANIVQNRELSPEERRHYLTIIKEETERISSLIKDLFDLAQLDNNAFIINKEPVELYDFIRKIEQKLTPAFEEKGLKLVLFCPQRVYLLADPLRLEQIIYNLLDNALKYSENEGITKITVKTDNNDVLINIIDNGKGIPSADLPFLFHRFYRVEKSRTRASGGSGLGLSIVEELIHAHGGTITVQSRKNSGTEFAIKFKGALLDEDNLTR
ncbi:ATP-binding protein [Cytobacillus horneckiae]|uniref:sensor histidine kinase n=1 Tax=Cytobacillus horneckiae TaxID=549687 RepID=UPI003D9A6D59